MDASIKTDWENLPKSTRSLIESVLDTESRLSALKLKHEKQLKALLKELRKNGTQSFSHPQKGHMTVMSTQRGDRLFLRVKPKGRAKQ